MLYPANNGAKAVTGYCFFFAFLWISSPVRFCDNFKFPTFCIPLAMEAMPLLTVSGLLSLVCSDYAA